MIFKNSERRNDLDKAYRNLVAVVFKNIERAAVENQKTPADVIQFGKCALLHSLNGTCSPLMPRFSYFYTVLMFN